MAMTNFRHTTAYIVRVVERPGDGDQETWFTGPFGHTESGHVAQELEESARGRGRDREVYVEPLFAREEGD